LPRGTRRRAAAGLRPTACLIGDTIGRRPALHAPGLDRPVAFLDGRPVAPLLDRLGTAPTLADAVEHWDLSWPGRGQQVADWLHRHDLLEIADP
jgi:hypothetical protein